MTDKVYYFMIDVTSTERKSYEVRATSAGMAVDFLLYRIGALEPGFALRSLTVSEPSDSAAWAGEEQSFRRMY